MISLDSVLVVEDSRVLREVVQAVLSPHAKRVVVAASVEEAGEILDETPDFGLLLTDVYLPDGTGFDVLARLRRNRPEARVILMTARWEEADAERAKAMGALAYLPKPIAFRDIARELRKEVSRVAPRPERRRSVARALLRDPLRPGAPHLVWEIRDLSASGAFLETTGPVPMGSLLHLELRLGEATVRVGAVVARVQEPAWGGAGGVGVYFAEIDDETRALIERHLAETQTESF